MCYLFYWNVIVIVTLQQYFTYNIYKNILLVYNYSELILLFFSNYFFAVG